MGEACAEFLSSGTLVSTSPGTVQMMGKFSREPIMVSAGNGEQPDDTMGECVPMVFEFKTQSTTYFGAAP